MIAALCAGLAEREGRAVRIAVLKRFVCVYVVPTAIMALGGSVARNPDGVLFVALACMLMANRHCQPVPRADPLR
jgi:hypothetical protein